MAGGNPGTRRGSYRKALTPRQLAILERLRRVEAVYREAEAERARLALAAWDEFVPGSRIGEVLGLSANGATTLLTRWRRKRERKPNWWRRDGWVRKHDDCGRVVCVDTTYPNGGQWYGGRSDNEGKSKVGPHNGRTVARGDQAHRRADRAREA